MRRALLQVSRLALPCSVVLVSACADLRSGDSQALFYVQALEYPVGQSSEFKYGFMDRTGASVIDPSFDRIGFTNVRFLSPSTWEGAPEGLIRVAVGDRWGFVDGRGRYVVAPSFDDARSFSEGLALVKSGERWGFIDPEGRYRVNPRFEDATAFSSGVAAVKVGELWGFIDRRGDFVLEPQFNDIGLGTVTTRSPRDAWRPTSMQRSAGWGTDAVFWEGASEGLIRVMVSDRWGYIDGEGRYVINPQFDQARGFSEGLAGVRIGERWGYIDREGRFAINPAFRQAGNFSEGLAAAAALTTVLGSPKWGYVDRTGDYVVAPEFDDVGTFSEGLANVRVGDSWGYVDRVGKYIAELRFDDARPFSEGLAAVESEDRWGYIDREGEYVVAPQFNSVENMTGGLMLVTEAGDDGDWRYIDQSGRVVWSLFESYLSSARRAAEEGHSEAQYDLGYIYSEGEMGIPKDLPQAYAWFAAAASQGDSVARAKRDAVASELDATSLAEAQRLARQFGASSPTRSDEVAEAALEFFAGKVRELDTQTDSIERELLRNQASIDSIDNEILKTRNRMLEAELEARRQEDAARQQQAERRRICGARTCVTLDDGRVLFQTQDGSRWFFRNGRLAPRELWPSG